MKNSIYWVVFIVGLFIEIVIIGPAILLTTGITPVIIAIGGMWFAVGWFLILIKVA